MLDLVLHKIKKLIPEKIFNFFQPIYHWLLSFVAVIIYRFPSNKITVIAVTGTKGKSSVTEILGHILEKARYKVAISNTIRFKIDKESKENMYKMSTPGRFAVQRFLRKAVDENCDIVIMEVTSQASLLYRHLFINFDALIVTNISQEHIEAHGSFEKYIEAKLNIAKALQKSKKKIKRIIFNAEDENARRFSLIKVDETIPYRANDLAPYQVFDKGLALTIGGKEIKSELSGLFNIWNISACVALAKALNVDDETIREAVSVFRGIRGRVERVVLGQDFNVIVDYAHTPDSLSKLYDVFTNTRRICVLGGTGGGRDNWKRKEMGRIADKACDEIILTDEDPYDEDPNKIIEDIKTGISEHEPKVIIDRRQAIRHALLLARTGDSVLITGKGTDPYIMRQNGTKEPWDDARIAKEELEKIFIEKRTEKAS